MSQSGSVPHGAFDCMLLATDVRQLNARMSHPRPAELNSCMSHQYANMPGCLRHHSLGRARFKWNTLSPWLPRIDNNHRTKSSPAYSHLGGLGEATAA